MSLPVLSLWTDGSAEGRAGRPGGWAFIAVENELELAQGSGGAPSTTCVVMELEAVRQALLEAKSKRWHRTHRLEVVSDSSIALEAVTGRALPRPYLELAQQVHALAAELAVGTRKVRAHAGLRWNELADARALAAKLAAPPKRRESARARRP